MTRALAINVAANTTLPGFRAPIYPDGTFEYVPIPEREPTEGPVPTYGDLDLGVTVPPDLRDRRVHLDPEFGGVHGAGAYTYGDEHGVKAGPISTLESGDRLLFYATLEPAAGHPLVDGPGDPGDYPDWIATDWGAYLIGEFVLDAAPVTGEEYDRVPERRRRRFESNAHVERRTFDAKVLVSGDPDRSRLLDRAFPLSDPGGGAGANRVVTDLSNDSGKGPWWRRPLRFDPTATDRLLELVADRDVDRATG